jgi:hypothetical protein
MRNRVRLDLAVRAELIEAETRGFDKLGPNGLWLGSNG